MSESDFDFRNIYEQNYGKVMRLCMGYVSGDMDAAKDLAQEVFIKVWTNLETFRKESNISTWIYRIAVNTCLSSLQKSKKSKKFYNIEAVAETPQEAATTADRYIMLEELYKCINTLSETNKAIILLELEGLPQKEIAKVIGIKHEAIRTRIHRIKNELTKCVNNG